MMKKIDDLDLEGKRVLVRVDYNVPLKNGRVSDDTRIRKSLPTLKHLLEKNCRIVVMSHLGRPHKDMKKGVSIEEVKKRWTIEPVRGVLEGLLGEKVVLAKDYVENNIPDEKVVLLENLRIYPGEKANDEEFARRLASFADFFVSDGFGVCHRDQASVTSVVKFIPSCAGLLVEDEVENLSKILNPKKPFVAIIGGAKADKIGVIKSLLPKVDKLIIGGVLANTFAKAKGIDIKGSKFDEKTLELAKDLVDDEKIILPEDVLAADKFEECADVKDVNFNEIPDDWIAVDIGEKTVEKYKNVLKDAKTVVWCGPLGVFEIDDFAKGTKEIAEFISGLDAVTIIGGGDSAAAVNKLGFADKMSHVSTGGGASLELIQGKELPGLKVLGLYD